MRLSFFCFFFFVSRSKDTVLSLYTDITHVWSFKGETFYTGHFDMANAMIRRHLSEAEMWSAVGMVEFHREVGAALGVYHTIITRAWASYQQYTREEA